MATDIIMATDTTRTMDNLRPMDIGTGPTMGRITAMGMAMGIVHTPRMAT